MRKNRREIAAVFTACAVILAAGVSSTTQMPVVCAEEEHDDGTDDLTAQEGNDQATDRDETGDDEPDADTDTDDVPDDTGDDEPDVDTDTDDVSDDTRDEIEEDGVLLTSAASTFLLGDSRSSEIVWDNIKTMGELKTLLEEHTDDTPVRARLSEDIRITEMISLSKILILELDNHTISSDSTAVSIGRGGVLTITNSGANGTLNSTSGPVISVTGGELVMNDGGVTTESGNAINVTSGSVKISGGTVRGNDCAIYIDGGEVAVSGGSVEAGSSAESLEDVHAIHVKSGKLTVSGGYIVANGETGSGSLCIQGGSAEITGGNFETSVNGDYGYACYVTGSAGITIKGGNFGLDARAGKSLYIDTGGAVSVSGGTYDNRIGIKTGVGGNNAAIGEWADSFYRKFKGGILSDNSFWYENDGIVYTNQSVTVKSGTWDGKCEEARELEVGTYSFGSDGWRVHDDSRTVYDKGTFYALSEAMYFFTKE